MLSDSGRDGTRHKPTVSVVESWLQSEFTTIQQVRQLR